MPDISMCRDDECPSRKSCYRFMATECAYQSYLVSPREDGADKCDSYWPLKRVGQKDALDRALK